MSLNYSRNRKFQDLLSIGETMRDYQTVTFLSKIMLENNYSTKSRAEYNGGNIILF